ncbi:hypothetical protein C8Q75DRAFT_808049 [Abortiporus biennis]|nr:hypothetical protein C8Q75DRAFT_808049 [Abortiporus biennis]
MSSSILFANELWLHILLSDGLEYSDYDAISRVSKRLVPIARPFLFSKMNIKVNPDIEAIQRGEASFQTYIDETRKRLDYFLTSWATTVRSVSATSTQFAFGALDEVDPEENLYKEARREVINAIFDKLISFPKVETLDIDFFFIERRYFTILENLPLRALTLHRCLVKHKRIADFGNDEDAGDNLHSEGSEEDDDIEDPDTHDSIEDELPPSDFHIQHLRQIFILENVLSPCASTWQGLIDSLTVEEITTDGLCFPLLKVLRRLPLLPKLETLRLPGVTLMYDQIDALKDTLTKCPNLTCLELGWFAGFEDDLPFTISPDSIPKLKHITAHLHDLLTFLPNRPVESITLISPVVFSDEEAVRYLKLASHQATHLRRLNFKFAYLTNVEEEEAALHLLAELFTVFSNLEEFVLTSDSDVLESFASKICELIAMHPIHTRIRMFKYYSLTPGRYSSRGHQESEERRLDGLYCDNELTRRLRSCCPNLEVVVVQGKEEY